MARARNIKPGFAKNEDLAECSIAARLCFALLPTLADREGRLEDRPKRIKGELFAFDSIEVDPLLAELARRGFIERYAVDGRGLIQIIAFHKHQHPHHKEPESTLPPPPSLRLSHDGKWLKPEALPSCDEPKAPDKPETFSPTGGQARRQNREGARGSNRVDSGALIPERGFQSGDGNSRAPGPDPENPTPTPAGAVCLAIRQRGMADVNPSDPRLLALLEQGATRDEIAAVAGEAVDKGKGWAWMLHVVAARRADAAALQLAAPARSASNGAPSFEASQAYLREQAEHRAVPPPPEVIAKLRSVVKVVS